LEAILNYLDKYSAQIFVLQIGLLFILTAIILYVYFYNRKKYHNLKHQIPASVVKNYLDSIIQNSTALKSSLFRGGGLDVDPSSIPSVLPLDQMAGGQVGVDLGNSGSSDDGALRAEIARLQAQLGEKESIITDLEGKNTELNGIVTQKQERIEELEALLADALANVGGGDNSELEAKIAEITAERDQIKDDLSQYEMIEDDLADLKRLRQENEQLKSALGDGDAPVAAAPAAEPVPEAAAPAPAVEEPAAEPVVEEPVAAAETVEAAPEPAADEAADKSPEDLLSEFEKMLG
jgi:regulator of replication initiation timing